MKKTALRRQAATVLCVKCICILTYRMPSDLNSVGLLDKNGFHAFGDETLGTSASYRRKTGMKEENKTSEREFECDRTSMHAIPCDAMHSNNKERNAN